MEDTRHERISSLFDQACELPREQRDEFLIRACGEDEELRKEVESLLRYEDDTSERLATGAVMAGAQEAFSPTPEFIGPYRVLERLGEGGMGVVYLAEQSEPIRRRVAVKLIQPGIESRRIFARFQSERQVLARMSHSSIARVYDAGETEQGRPYFVMEYVRGKPITDHCTEAELPLRARLELFAQVCDGVQHAHQKAIIHRDLKPSNVLIAMESSRPVPKIIDFGVAKAIDRPVTQETLFTGVGQLIGTPDYMSPEQAAMSGEEIDTRSDVYSLGVLLYELVTGRRPFNTDLMQRSSFEEILRVIREDVPPVPSKRVTDAVTRRRLRGDLDWIVMRALEKEPDRRYASTAELVADVRRHLAGEVVLARRPDLGYRIGKFVRRHKIGVAFAATMLVVLGGYAVTMSLAANRLAEERDRSAHSAAESDEMLRFVMSLFEGASPAGGRGEITALQLLEEGVQRIETEFPNRPLLRARLMQKMADVYELVGHDAEDFMLRALDIYRQELGNEDAEYLEYLSLVAERYLNLDDPDQAEPLYLELCATLERIHGPDDETTLQETKRLGLVYVKFGNYEEAERILREALTRSVARWGEDGEPTLGIRGALGVALIHADDIEDAVSVLGDALVTMRKQSPNSTRTRAATYNLAISVVKLGEHERAVELLREALEGKFMFSRLAMWRGKGFAPLREHPDFVDLVKGDGCWDYEMMWPALEEEGMSAALDHMATAVELGCLNNAYGIESDPSYDPFRAEPRFKALLQEVRDRSAAAKAQISP